MFVCICMYICTFCMYMYVCIYRYIHMYIYIHIFMYIHLFLYIYICVCVCVCMYTYNIYTYVLYITSTGAPAGQIDGGIECGCRSERSGRGCLQTGLWRGALRPDAVCEASTTRPVLIVFQLLAAIFCVWKL